MEGTIKAGQYFAAAYNGDNGDLILGRVQSVRVNGSVILDNLLTGGTSTKKTAVLRRRNKKISKREADKLIKLHKSGVSKQNVRKAAVRAPAIGEKQKELNFSKKPVTEEATILATATRALFAHVDSCARCTRADDDEREDMLCTTGRRLYEKERQATSFDWCRTSISRIREVLERAEKLCDRYLARKAPLPEELHVEVVALGDRLETLRKVAVVLLRRGADVQRDQV